MQSLIIVLGIVLGLVATALIYLPFMQKKCPFCHKRVARKSHRCSHCFAKLG